MKNNLLEQSKTLQRSKQTKKQPDIDLSGFFDGVLGAHRLSRFTEYRNLKNDVESYRGFLRNLSKIDLAKMITSLMVMKSGDAESLNLSEIARRGGSTRAALHSAFGKRDVESGTRALLLEVIRSFNSTIQQELGKLLNEFSSKSPFECLLHVFEAVQRACDAQPEYAIATMQQLSLNSAEEMRIIAPSYEMAIKLYRSGASQTNEHAKIFEDFQVIHNLLFIIRSAILQQFGEGKLPIPESGGNLPEADEKLPEKNEFLSQDAAYIMVLMGLKMYASESAATLIEKQIEETKEKLKASL